MTGAFIQRGMHDYYAARDVLVRRYFSQPWRPGAQQYPVWDRTLELMHMESMRCRLQTHARLVRPSHVHAVGVGGKNDTGEPAVVVYVTHKLPEAEVPRAELVPRTIDGVPTDVVQSRIPRLAGCTDERRGVHRPLIGGVSVGRQNGPSGTLAAFVRSTRTGDPADATFLLSNSHVLFSGRGRPENVRVVQPASDDGEGGIVATLVRATRITMGSPIRADAAIARLHDGGSARNEICSIGRISATAAPSRGADVEMHGRTSGRTVGRVETTGLAAEVLDDRGRTLQFLDAFRVAAPADATAVAGPGDSGALVVEEGTGTAVGLLYAADELGSFYFAHPIENVCQELEIALKLE